MSKKIPSALLLNDIHVSKDNIPEFQKNWARLYIYAINMGLKI